MWGRIPPELRRYLWIEGRSSRRECWQIEGLTIASYWFIGTGAGVVAELSGEPTLILLQACLLLARGRGLVKCDPVCTNPRRGQRS